MKILKVFILTFTLLPFLSQMQPSILAEETEEVGEPSLQQWLTDRGYSINVTTDETGIETFPPGSYRVAILDEFAAFATNNTFGWYPVNSKEFHEIFSGEDSVGATTEFSSPERFGLYLRSPEGDFYTESELNRNGDDHAWIFADPKTQDGCVVAWEDLYGLGDKDYQDMILSIKLLPPPPPPPEFAVRIEDKWTMPGEEYEFTALSYGRMFKAEVRIDNVVNLFGYRFWLEFDPSLIQISDYEVRHIHAEDVVSSEEVDNLNGVYRQAVTAQSWVKSFNGSAPVADLWFYIKKDPCYPYNFTGVLKLENTTMNDESGSSIYHIVRSGYFKILSVRPEISVLHEGEEMLVEWIVNSTFTLDVTISNIVQMKGFHLQIAWGDWLETDSQNVEVTSFLPSPYMIYLVRVNETSLTVEVQTFAEKPAVNGTGKILEITFKTENPWELVPPYTLVDSIYHPENSTCQIVLADGWIYTRCPENSRMHLYNSSYGVGVKANFTCNFTPIPGDLNLDGVVDIVDLSTISGYEGCELGDLEWSECCYFDLNKDERIDIFDIIIVAVNFGKTSP